MSTTNRTIPIFGPGGLEIGRMSPTMYQALIDLMNGEDAPKPVSPQEIMPAAERCVECASCKRQIGIFCPDCFSELRKNAAFSALWHGRDWQQALDAAREVTNG